jgi:hypothetical protein
MDREDHDLIVKVGRDMEHVKEALGRIHTKLDDGFDKFEDHGQRIVALEGCSRGQGREIKEHKDGHWKLAGLLLTVCSLAAAGIGLLLKFWSV